MQRLGTRGRGSCGSAATKTGQNRRTRTPSMEFAGILAGKEKERLGKTMSGHGFAKGMACRCRGRRDEPLSGDGFCGGRQRWPGNLAEGSPELGRSKTSALNLARYEWRLTKWVILLEISRRGEHRQIYSVRLPNRWKNVLFSELMNFRIKIISEKSTIDF